MTQTQQTQTKKECTCELVLIELTCPNCNGERGHSCRICSAEGSYKERVLKTKGCPLHGERR